MAMEPVASSAKVTPRSGLRAEKRAPLSKHVWMNRYLYLMLIPGLAYYLIFHYLPMYGAIIAFKNFNLSKGILGSPWAGLYHFRELFGQDKFWEVFRNTLLISLYRLIFGFPAPIIAALLLNEVRKMAFKRTIQTIIYLPHFVSWVIMGGILVSLLSLDYGMINHLLARIGIEPIPFLSSPSYFRSVLVGSMIWKEFGWNTIIYMAALAGINPQLYEAAMIDGASRFQRMLYITLPGIKHTIVILLILRMGYMMEAGFEQIFVLLNATVISVADIIDTYVYQLGLEEGQFSLAAAVGLFKSLINFSLLLIANRLAKAMGERGLY
ncbi:ABC transporter permease [Paenibacillus sp. HJGM_3]|uniref:ABC transporter permease n=1 Tax=Paenibacillus sp. HJGM_3 TaxID=3379816 RepID=UPI00385CEB06